MTNNTIAAKMIAESAKSETAKFEFPEKRRDPGQRILDTLMRPQTLHWTRAQHDPLPRPPGCWLLTPTYRQARRNTLRAGSPNLLLSAETQRRAQRGPRNIRLRPRRPARPDPHGAKAERRGAENGTPAEGARCRACSRDPVRVDGIGEASRRRKLLLSILRPSC